MRTRTKFTIFCIISLITFTVAVLILAAFDKSVPDSLIVSFFSAFTVELGLLFGIKIKSKE